MEKMENKASEPQATQDINVGYNTKQRFVHWFLKTGLSLLSLVHHFVVAVILKIDESSLYYQDSRIVFYCGVFYYFSQEALSILKLLGKIIHIKSE